MKIQLMFSRLRLGGLRFCGGLANLAGFPGVVREGDYVSGKGATVRVRKSALYTVVTVNGVDVYFYRLSGGIDGVGVSRTSDCTASVTPASDVSDHAVYWLYRLLDAIDSIEKHGICRVDLDCLAPSEENRIRMFLGILQDFAYGYREDGPQPRLSQALRILLERNEAAASLPLSASWGTGRTEAVSEKRKYDSTVARIAGNIAGHYVNNDFTNSDEAIAEWSVALARAIVAEVERTEPKPETAGAPPSHD